MNIVNVLRLSGGALDAQQMRMQVAASNLANAESTRTPEGGPYLRRQVVFRAVDTGPGGSSFASELDRALQGVQVVDVQRDTLTPLRRVHDPAHVDAGPDGYVSLPNVDTVSEMVDMMQASHSYEANLAAATTTRSLAFKALDIGK